MVEKKLKVGIVGCGNIAGPYARTLQPYDHIEIAGATDLIPQRAKEFVDTYGGVAYPTLQDLLADKAVEVVVNLTIHHAHPTVIAQCLNAGKHVHTEKPLAMTYAEARALVDMAEAKGLRLSSSPITFMGEAQQTAWRVIREGRLGKVRVVYAEVNHGRIESWHPNPEPFYKVGVLFDVGVYPLTLLTTMFGPARRVTAYATVLHPDRVAKDGTPFHVDTPDWSVAAIELADGTVARLTSNFYVRGGKQRGLEFHGDLGSLYLGCFQEFNAPVEFARYGESYTPVPYARKPYEGIEWARALTEMADAMAAGRPQRATGAQAAHVVEILCAITTSYQRGGPVEIESDFTPPAPMEWAA